MNQHIDQDTLSREHHFYVATAKHVFIHQAHGIVFVRDPLSLKDAAQYGLTPLILYGVTVPGMSLMWITFSLYDKPLSFSKVLEEAWNNGVGLRGKPDTLKINRHVAAACPEIVSCLAKEGVAVVTVDGNDKRFSASLRSAHRKCIELDHHIGPDALPVTTLEGLLSCASEHHQWDSQKTMIFSYSMSVERRMQILQWLELPFRPLTSSIPEVDWNPGPGLSSWEANLPPSSPRYFTEGLPKWLLTGEAEDYEDVPDDDNYEEVSPLKTIKLMMASWPNTVSEIAQEIGITRRELQWFLSCRVDLPEPVLRRLLSLLNIYMVDGYYEAVGPCILIARAPRAIAQAYIELSKGGDLIFSFEALPEKGAPDPSWRYLVFKAWGSNVNVIMIPRGSQVSEQFNSKLFINYDGETRVSMSLYRDIVKTCANACIAPAENYREMKRFLAQNNENLCSFQRQPWRW